VLGLLRCVHGQPVGSGDHDRGHPVGPPHARRATEGDQHAVHRLGEVPEGHLLAEDAAEAAGVRQRAEQHERRLTPRGVVQLKPVPLDLLARRVLDLDPDRVAAAVLAHPAHGPQLQATQLTHERRIGAVEPGVDELAVKHRRVDVRVIDEPCRQIVAKRLRQLGARPRRTPTGRARYLRIVLRSRPVCRAIAATVQPRARRAWISTSSSSVSIPQGSSSTGLQA
jgi:hypothetical protein